MLSSDIGGPITGDLIERNEQEEDAILIRTTKTQKQNLTQERRFHSKSGKIISRKSLGGDFKSQADLYTELGAHVWLAAILFGYWFL